MLRHSTEPHRHSRARQPWLRARARRVRREFRPSRHELGGACCAYRHGEKVVDLWGGVRNKATGEPWEQDTMVIVYSATKGLAAMTMAIAHSRGWLDYEAPVCRYWPEFAQQGKEKITVRQLLAHQAGLFVLDEPVDRSLVADPDRLARRCSLVRSRPGSRGRVRRITRSRSGSTKASSCGGSIPGIAPSASSSRTRSRRRSVWRPTSGCRRRCRTRASRRSRGRRSSRCCWALGSASCSRRMNPRSNIVRALRGSQLPARRTASLRAQLRSAVRRRHLHGARDRARLQRLRDRRPGTGHAPGDAAAVGRTGDSAGARLPRRVPGERHGASSRSAS